jgi:hypothetical protein
MPPPGVLRIDLLPRSNALRFVVGDGALSAPRPGEATIDIGERGALLGIELRSGATPAADEADAALYLPIAPERSGPHDRSVAAAVELRFGPDGALTAIDLPRRGAGYEITYPSGNQ